MDSITILKLADALTPSEAEELIAKMRSREIKGDSLRILHNYVKNQLTRIVHARRIDSAELAKWGGIDEEVEALIAQVFPFTRDCGASR